MNEAEFADAADAALTAVVAALEASNAPCDFDVSGDGIVALDFEDGSRIIINRHTAAREIWVAARSGGYHFRREAGRWVDTRDGSELFPVLSRLISEQSAQAVTLRAPG